MWYYFYLEGEEENVNWWETKLANHLIISKILSCSNVCMFIWVKVVLCKAIKQLLTGTGKTLF